MTVDFTVRMSKVYLHLKIFNCLRGLQELHRGKTYLIHGIGEKGINTLYSTFLFFWSVVNRYQQGVEVRAVSRLKTIAEGVLSLFLRPKLWGLRISLTCGCTPGTGRGVGVPLVSASVLLRKAPRWNTESLGALRSSVRSSECHQKRNNKNQCRLMIHPFSWPLCQTEKFLKFYFS